MKYLQSLVQKAVFSLTIFAGSVVFAQDSVVEDVKAVKDGVDAVKREMSQPKNLQDVAAEQMDTVKNLIDMIIEFCVKYSFQVIGGLIVLVLGWIVAGYMAKWVLKFFEKKGIDVTVSKFIAGTVKLTVLIFAIIVALGKFGIEIAPLIAGISVIGFGTSFALQGPLSNYAAGISLIFTKPFKVGEIIEVAGVMGKVLDIKLPRTELRTIDGTFIIIPNKHIIGEIIQNFSNFKRLDISVGVSYDSDMEKVTNIIKDVLKKEKLINQDKEPTVGISEFGDSSVNFFARVWCNSEDYWQAMASVNKNIFDEFRKQNIEIPFPQRDVHLVKEG